MTTNPPKEALQKRPESNHSKLKNLLEHAGTKKQLQTALARHMDPDRFVRVALTTALRQPKLAECSTESIIQSLLSCAQMGVEPDGRHAHLIPFWNGKAQRLDVQLILDYKGMVKLVRQSGDVSYIHCDVVYENDTFDYILGSGAFLKHKPFMDGDRGNPVAAYSFVKLKDGGEDFDVMSVSDVNDVRDGSQNYQNAQKKGFSTPWHTNWAEMAKKTAFRRHSKWLPLSYEVAEALSKDDEPLTERERFDAAKPVFSDPTPNESALNLTPEPEAEPKAAPVAKEKERHPAEQEEDAPQADAEEGFFEKEERVTWMRETVDSSRSKPKLNVPEVMVYFKENGYANEDATGFGDMTEHQIKVVTEGDMFKKHLQQVAKLRKEEAAK